MLTQEQVRRELRVVVDLRRSGRACRRRSKLAWQSGERSLSQSYAEQAAGRLGLADDIMARIRLRMA